MAMEAERDVAHGFGFACLRQQIVEATIQVLRPWFSGLASMNARSEVGKGWSNPCSPALPCITRDTGRRRWRNRCA
jgi:hypothetical protein